MENVKDNRNKRGSIVGEGGGGKFKNSKEYTME